MILLVYNMVWTLDKSMSTLMLLKIIIDHRLMWPRFSFVSAYALCCAYMIGKLSKGTMVGFPANTKHLHNIYTTSAQHVRRWSNIE